MAENGTFVFVTLHVGHVFWSGHFDVRGGAVVLLVRRLVSVEGFFTLDCGSGDNSQKESFDGNVEALAFVESFDVYGSTATARASTRFRL